MQELYTIEPVKTFTDRRGAVVFPFQDPSAESSRPLNLHAATIMPGAVRGAHAHPDHEERLLVMGSDVRLVFQSEDGSKAEERTGPDPMLVTIRRGVAHAIVNDGPSPRFLVCWHTGAGEVGSEPRTVVL